MATAELKEPPHAAPAVKGKTGANIQCLVVTPEKTVTDEVVEFVAVPLFDGELGILPGRSPLIGRLGYGELRTHTAGVTHRYFIDGGFVQVRDNVVTVLTHRSIPAGRIDVVAADAELQKARTRVATTDDQLADKEKAIARARALLRIAENKSV